MPVFFSAGGVNALASCYDFIRREGLSLAIWFDIVRVRIRRKYTHDSQDFCKCSSVDVFGTKARMERVEYSLV